MGLLIYGGSSETNGITLISKNYQVHVSKYTGLTHEEKFVSHDRIRFSLFDDIIVPILGVFALVGFFYLVTHLALIFLRTIVYFGAGTISAGVLAYFFHDWNLTPDFRKFHAAEHKVVEAYNNYDRPTREDVISSSREAINCGTSYVFWVILFLSLIPIVFVYDVDLGMGITFSSLLLFVCVLMIVFQYTIFPMFLRKISAMPGLLMQRYVFTMEPDDFHIDLAIKAAEKIQELEKAHRNKR